MILSNFIYIYQQISIWIIKILKLNSFSARWNFFSWNYKVTSSSCVTHFYIVNYGLFWSFCFECVVVPRYDGRYLRCYAIDIRYSSRAFVLYFTSYDVH